MNLRLLKSILEQPTAPFREKWVTDLLTSVLTENGVSFFRDPVGNLILGVSSEADYAALCNEVSDDPVKVFIAHMDHPGFHGEKWVDQQTLKVKWLGGSPRKHLNGAKVWVASNTGWQAQGILSQAKLDKSGMSMKSGVVKFKKGLALPQATEVYGGLAFRKPVWQMGKLVYTKAADDLVGVFALVSLSIELAKELGKTGKRVPFIGVLTRAEEVGFIGAIAHFDLDWLGKARREVLCVSLETSRTLPGAIVGKGPVVRLGDRITTFDSSALEVFTSLAKKLLKDKFQRRIMDGGTCEGTVATAYGFRTVAISIPLGNYHNQSFEGGPDSRGALGPAPEFVHVDDVAGMLKLCRGLVLEPLPWRKPWVERRAWLQTRMGEYAPLLNLT